MSSNAKELLLEDYRYRAESLWRNEQGGETRVNLFIGLVTLALAIFGAIGGNGSSEEAKIALSHIFVILLVLLFLGVTTMLRMVTRNRNTDEAKHQLDMIRQRFKDYLDDDVVLKGYELFRPGKGGSRIKPRKFGGLSHTMAIINSLIGVGFAALLIDAFQSTMSFQPQAERIVMVMGGIMATAVFLAALWVQLRYINAEEDKTRDKLNADKPSHAGGVVYKVAQGDVEYLAARANSNQGEWILPKGKIKEKERHIEAALREIKEETGCWGRARGLLERLRFNVRGKEIDCKFYLVEAIYEGPGREGREVNWFKITDALEELEHDESRYLLLRAEQQLAKLGSISQSE